MRAAKIIAAVAMAVALGSTPSSSWDVSPKRQESRSCQAGSAISLLGSSGAAGIALISSDRCSP